MISLEKAIDLLSGRNRRQSARVAAYVIAPSLVLSFALAGIYKPGMGLDFGRPITVTALQTEIGVDGRVTEKRGFALTVEPTETDFQIPFDTAVAMWVSLDPATARANRRRLELTPTELAARWPLVGVNIPVTVVVQAKPGSEILLPGGRDLLEAWQPQSRRSLSFISQVLFSCVFAFGMSLAKGLPPGNRNKDTRRQERRYPHEHEIVERHTIDPGPGMIGVSPRTEMDGDKVPGIPDERNK